MNGKLLPNAYKLLQQFAVLGGALCHEKGGWWQIKTTHFYNVKLKQ